MAGLAAPGSCHIPLTTALVERHLFVLTLTVRPGRWYTAIAGVTVAVPTLTGHASTSARVGDQAQTAASASRGWSTPDSGANKSWHLTLAGRP